MLACASAHAEKSESVADQLVKFAFDGCDYLHANGWDAKARRPTAAAKLAAHFGRVLKKQPSGMTFEYELRSPGFPEWAITFSSLMLTLRPPPAVTLTLGELERVLGPSDVPEGDNAKPAVAPSTGAKRPELVEFGRHDGHRLCVIQAIIDRNRGDAGASRVLSFRFSD